MRCQSYQVLVVGGGPAGLATAMELLQQGLAVTVIERSAYDDLRIGEHVQPSAVLKLRTIGSKSNLRLDGHFASAGVIAYWGSESANFMDYFLHAGQQGLNLSRPRFDADLALACEACGATVRRSTTLLRAVRRISGWDVEIVEDGTIRSLSASFIVDATGRAATFARRQGASVRAHDRQIAVVAFGTIPNGRTAHRRSIVEAAESGWWYSAIISPERRICMFVTDDDLLPRGKRDLQAWWVVQLRRTVQLSQWSGEFESPEGLVVRSARSQHLDPAFGTGWLAVGDAAMAFDPLSSQGIAKALDHGKRAASSIAAYFSGDRLSLETFSCQLQLEYANYLATRARYCRLEMRWPRSLFWKRRHDRAIALADGTS